MEMQYSETTQVQIKLSGQDIIQLLLEKGTLPRLIGAKGEAFFDVPGGGDYSNTTLSVDSDNMIRIEYSGNTLKKD